MSGCKCGCRAYLNPPWWVTMGFAPRGQNAALFRIPHTAAPPPGGSRTPPDDNQPPPDGKQQPPDDNQPPSGNPPPFLGRQVDRPPGGRPQPAGGIASVVITPASVMNLGDVMNVTLSMTRPAVTSIAFHAVLYQALENGTY
jgi:hypothetical protein